MTGLADIRSGDCTQGNKPAGVAIMPASLRR